MIAIEQLQPHQLSARLAVQTGERTSMMPLTALVAECLEIGVARQDALLPTGRSPLHFPIVAGILASDQATARFERGQSETIQPHENMHPDLSAAVRVLHELDPQLTNPEFCGYIFGRHVTSVHDNDRSINVGMQRELARPGCPDFIRGMAFAIGMRCMASRKIRHTLRPHAQPSTKILIPAGEETAYWERVLLGDEENSGVLYKYGYHELARGRITDLATERWHDEAAFNISVLTTVLLMRSRNFNPYERDIDQKVIGRNRPRLMQRLAREDFRGAWTKLEQITKERPNVISPVSKIIMQRHAPAS